MNEPASVRKLNREQRADLHYARRASWIRARLRSSDAACFGIASLSEPQRFHLCDGWTCTCPDFRFHGLSSLRMGRAGAHQPCSHVIAVQRVITESQAAIAESQRT